jgi:hypothetical protein
LTLPGRASLGSPLTPLAFQRVPGHEPNSRIAVGQQVDQLWNRPSRTGLVDGFAASGPDGRVGMVQTGAKRRQGRLTRRY